MGTWVHVLPVVEVHTVSAVPVSATTHIAPLYTTACGASFAQPAALEACVQVDPLLDDQTLPSIPMTHILPA
jgi:hypothetical protein